MISNKSWLATAALLGAALVGAAAVYASELGVRPREVVAVAMPGTIDHVILSLALIRIGAVPLPALERRMAQFIADGGENPPVN